MEPARLHIALVFDAPLTIKLLLFFIAILNDYEVLDIHDIMQYIAAIIWY